MIERAISYSRDVMEVLMQTQANALKALGQHMIPQGFGFPTSDEWSKTVDTMSEGVRDVSERGAAAAESQVRSVTEAATSSGRSSPRPVSRTSAARSATAHGG